MQVDVSLTLPDTAYVTSKDVKRITVYALFEKGILTSGQAAEALGLSKRAFLETASLYGVSVFRYDTGELEDEIVGIWRDRFDENLSSEEIQRQLREQAWKRL